MLQVHKSEIVERVLQAKVATVFHNLQYILYTYSSALQIVQSRSNIISQLDKPLKTVKS